MDDMDKGLAVIAGQIEKALAELVEGGAPFVLIVPTDKARVVSTLDSCCVRSLMQSLIADEPRSEKTFAIQDDGSVTSSSKASAPPH